MLRALAVSFAMLAVIPGPCAAQSTPPAADFRNRSGINQPTPNSNSAAGSSSGEDSAAENELLQAANRSRELAGVPPLRMEERLREAARAHARRMIASQRLEHQLSGEPSLLERIALVSPLSALKIDRAGENIANATCAPGANDALMRSAPHRENLLDRAFNVVSEMRQLAGLPELVQLAPPNLDQAACSLASENRPNARLLATAYDNRKIITYTQSHPEVLPQGALRMLRNPGVRQFAVGACYARNAAYPTGMYWVAILLY